MWYDQIEYPFIVAEVSQNHDGSLGQAHAFIDSVAEAGAQAIKFQTHIADEESTYNEPFRVKFSYCDKTRYDYWKRMEFTEEQWKGLYDHAVNRGLVFLSSPFSVRALEMLDQIGVSAWKFGSGEVFNNVLLEKAIATGKPIILSTGLSTVADINKQAELVTSNGNKLIILHCTTAYPTKPKETALSRIVDIKKEYGCITGFSDHSGEIYASLGAVALGAQMIEVHVTFSKHMFGPDVKASVDFYQLKQIVEGSKWIHDGITYYSDRIERSTDQEKLKKMFGKSLYAKKDIKQGDEITEEMIALKKPSDGIAVEHYHEIIGRRAKNQIKKGELVRWVDLEVE